MYVTLKLVRLCISKKFDIDVEVILYISKYGSETFYNSYLFVW